MAKSYYPDDVPPVFRGGSSLEYRPHEIKMSANDTPRLIFEGGFDERDAFEAKARGYRSHVLAELPCGDRYPLVFYDPVRLSQDLEEEVASGNGVIAEPGLVIVPEVTRQHMEAAVSRLFAEGFFEAFKSVASAVDTQR